MRIALFSNCALCTPPAGYGGTELFVAVLARSLRALGHEVTVWATRDSTVGAPLRGSFEHAQWPPSDMAELRHSEMAWRDVDAARASAEPFDVVHVQHAAALPFARYVDVPCVMTVHHAREEHLVPYYAAHPEVSLVAISARQAALHPELRFARVVHHGLDPADYPLSTRPHGYLAYLGRFALSKGTAVALDVADAAGLPIRLGGDAHPDSRAYFEHEIEPRLASSQVEWWGEVDHARKLRLLSGATALLAPLAWEEPFGLAMIESMLVGTPVVAFARGSATELIDEGVTGWIARDATEMRQLLRDVAVLDRVRCRERAIERFSAIAMARKYAALYQELGSQRRDRTEPGSRGTGPRLRAATSNGATR